MNKKVLAFDHLKYMQSALRLARKAYACDEVPVGAIVVGPDGTILGRGYNQVEKRGVQTGHAELIAITQAAKKRGDWRLDGCILYVTLEPCIMCMGLIRLSRFEAIIYGASSPLFGYRLDNEALSSVYKRDMIVEGGVCASESRQLMKQFFNKKRMNPGE